MWIIWFLSEDKRREMKNIEKSSQHQKNKIKSTSTIDEEKHQQEYFLNKLKEQMGKEEKDLEEHDIKRMHDMDDGF